MSAIELVKDIVTMNFTHAWARIKDYLINTLGVPPFVVAFVDKALTDEAKILASLVATAKADLSAASTTADYVAASKDIYAQLVAQNISTFNLQYVFAMINMAVSAGASV